MVIRKGKEIKALNILNVVYNFNTGGVERLIIDISNELVKRDVNCMLCIINDSYSDRLLEMIDSRVKVIHLEKKDKNRKLSYLMQLNRIIRENKIDVLHVHQGNLMSFFLIEKILNPGLKIFYTVHDTYIYSELSKKDQAISKLICKKMIAISDAVADDMSKNGVRSEQIKRVYNGVNFARFSQKRIPRKPGEGFRIVNVARFFPAKKGQDVLIKAAGILKARGYSFTVTFAGGPISGDETSMPEMKKLAEECGVSDIVTFLGNVTNVPEVLSRADCFCIPSRYEGFGISAVEAMGMGIPCVASNIVGLDEVVCSSEAGVLFEPGNENDLADKLAYVMEHSEQYVPDEIEKIVKSKFSIELMTDELLSCYSSR